MDKDKDKDKDSAPYPLAGLAHNTRLMSHKAPLLKVVGPACVVAAEETAVD